MQQAPNIEWYGRYRDDILIVTKPGNLVRSFIRQIVSKAATIYPIEREEVNSQSMSFLDVEFFKGDLFHRTGTLGFRPFFKPSSQRVPLNFCSSHPLNIHDAWPIAELTRLARHSSNHQVFSAARKQLLDNWRLHFMSAELISIMQKLPFNFLRTTCEKKQDKCHPFWLVLPFYKGFNYGLIGSALSAAVKPWHSTLCQLLNDEPVFRLSFKNTQGNLEKTLLWRPERR